ncbi:hypothetical protein K2X85_06490 [bacterium]|nr:hypothetical protein [bacterium]
MPEPVTRITLLSHESDNWRARKASIVGRHAVPIEDIFTPEYVRKNLQLLDFDAMLTECGFPVDLPSLDLLTTEQDEIWDEMIRSRSSFGSWVEILNDASANWVRRKIADEPIPPSRGQPRFPSREDLQRLRDVAAPTTPLLPPAVDPEQETFDPENIPASQVESWYRDGKAHFYARRFKGLGFDVQLFVVYLRRDQWTETLLLARDPREPRFRVRQRLDGFTPPARAKELYFNLLSQSLLQGEETVWDRLLRFLGVAESNATSSTFDLSIDLFNSVRSRDHRALASALEAIAQRSLPAGEALDAILAAARFIGELPDEAMEVSLDLVELILSIIGLIPGAGAAADAGSGVVAFAREDYLGTALAGAAILPMVGSAAGVARALQKLRQVEAKLAALSLPLQKILLDTLASIGSILSEWTSTPIGLLFARMKGVFNDAAERLRLFAKRKEPAKPNQPAAAPTSPDVNTPAAPPTPDRPPDQPKQDERPESRPQKSTYGDNIVRTSNPTTIEFRGKKVHGVRDLSHLSEEKLQEMKQLGRAAKAPDGRTIHLHHEGQSNDGDLFEITSPPHSIHDRNQHPLGNKKGVGLNKKERKAFDTFREAYWKARAIEEIKRRGKP